MKKTVKTKEGHVINFSYEKADGTPADMADLERLENNLLAFFLAKAEPEEDELFMPLGRCA